MKIKKKEGGIVVRAIFTCAEFAVRRIYNSGPKSFPYGGAKYSSQQQQQGGLRQPAKGNSNVRRKGMASIEKEFKRLANWKDLASKPFLKSNH